MSETIIKKSFILLLFYVGFFIFLFTTDPDKLPIGWLMLPFVWLFGLIFYTCALVINLFNPIERRTNRRLVICFLAAAVPTLMLLLDSVDQLTLRDSSIIIVLAGIGILYISKFHLTR